MDDELHFEWPEARGRSWRDAAPYESRPLARRKRSRQAEPPTPEEASECAPLLEEALDTIARLEGDRRAARQRITELEKTRDDLQARLTAQRRRLLLLERQLEDASMAPASDALAPTSWLDRLFGGLSSVPTA